MDYVTIKSFNEDELHSDFKESLSDMIIEGIFFNVNDNRIELGGNATKRDDKMIVDIWMPDTKDDAIAIIEYDFDIGLDKEDNSMFYTLDKGKVKKKDKIIGDDKVEKAIGILIKKLIRFESSDTIEVNTSVDDALGDSVNEVYNNLKDHLK